MLTLAETGEVVPKNWELVTFEPHLEDGLQPHHLYLNMTTADPVTGEPCRVVLPADLSMDIELLSNRRGGEKSLLADAAQEPAEDPAEAEKSKQGALQKEKKEAREMELEKKDKDVLVSSGAKVNGDAILRRAKPSPEAAGHFPAFRRDMKLSQDENAVLCMDKTTTASFIRSGALNRHTASRIRDIDQVLRRRAAEIARNAEKTPSAGGDGVLDAADEADFPLPGDRTPASTSPVNDEAASGRKTASPLRASLGRTVELLRRLDGPDPTDAEALDAALFSLPPSALPERRARKGPPPPRDGQAARTAPARWIDPHVGKSAPTQRMHGNWPVDIRRRLARNYYDYEGPRKRSAEKVTGGEKEKDPAAPAKSKEKASPEKKSTRSIVGLPAEPFRLEVCVRPGKGRIVVGQKQPPKYKDRIALSSEAQAMLNRSLTGKVC